jgi:hypothetical protein
MLRRMIFFAFLLAAVKANAQQTRPVLISHADSTRAIAFDSITRNREPFTTTTEIKFGSDSATRIMLFAMNLQLQPNETASAVTADAEDAQHSVHTMTVEYVGPVPNNPWVSSVVIRVPDSLPATGDVLVRIKYRDIASNRVRVGIGEVGGGPPDDVIAIPTPGLPNPSSLVTATNLSASDVQTILQQAASAAASLGKAVSIVVTDREGNIIGFFAMPGAPATTMIRSVGTAGQGLEGIVVPASDAATAKASTAAFISKPATPFQRAPLASSFRNIFHRASASVRAVRCTASSSLHCRAATSRSLQRASVSRRIRVVCRFIKTACPPAGLASKATDFTRWIAIQPTTISLSKS